MHSPMNVKYSSLLCT